MAKPDDEPSDSMESLSWPDTSRPISHDPGQRVEGAAPGYQEPMQAPQAPPERQPPPDPVIFGPDPFADQPPPDLGLEPTYYPRPRWPIVVAILLLVAGLVAALGLWVF